MTALTVTAAKVSADQTQGSIVRNYELAAEMTLGTLVSLDSSGKLTKAQADGTAAEARAIGILVAGPYLMGGTTIASGQRGSVCTFGPVYGFSGMTPGAVGWVSDTAGEIDTAPSSTNTIAAGRAWAADVFFVNIGVSDYS